MRPWGRRQEARECDRVGEIARRLEQLNQSTERDFLAVGSKLMDFDTAVRRISADMAALSELAAGSQCAGVTTALAAVLERAGLMQARARDEQDALGTLAEAAAGIQASVGGRRQMLRVFPPLATLTRIETARLGQAGHEFGSLAGEVQALAAGVQVRAEEVAGAAEELRGQTRNATQDLRRLGLARFEHLERVAADARKTVAELSDRQARANETSGRLAGQYMAVSEAVGELVTAIQFHDITRQQVEHVIESLREGAQGGHPREELGLQGAQLQAAAESFARSVESIGRSLREIGDAVRGMAGECRKVMGGTAGGSEVFFVELEQHLAAIVKTVEACLQSDTSVRSIAADLAGTAKRMRDSAERIELVDIEIRRLAVNAAVRAAHLGRAGDALSVLAATLERLASESEQQDATAGAALTRMAEAIARLLEAESDSEIDSAAELRGAVGELHSSAEASYSRMLEVNILAEELESDVRSAGESLAVGRLFAEVTAGCVKELREMAGDATPQDAERWAQASRRYTMDREREVQAHVLAAAANGAPVAFDVEAGNETPVTDSELGENVELF